MLAEKKTGRIAVTDLFGSPKMTDTPLFPPDSRLERLRQEFDILGFLCAGHPMAIYKKQLKKQSVVKAKDLRRFTGRRIRFAGLLITGKVVHTKKGEPMEFLTFEDETGTIETTFFPEAYHRFCSILDRSRPFLLHGKVEEDFGAQTLTVDNVAPLGKPVSANYSHDPFLDN